MKYYLSWVKEYPIYEPAEGGYYYPGEDVIYLKEFTSWKKTNKAFKQLLKDFVDLAEWYGMQYSVSYYGGVGKGIKYPNAQMYSKYIGHDEYIQLTRYIPTSKGYQPYC